MECIPYLLFKLEECVEGDIKKHTNHVCTRNMLTCDFIQFRIYLGHVIFSNLSGYLMVEYEV